MLIIADATRGGIIGYPNKLVEKLENKCEYRYIVPKPGKFQSLVYYTRLILGFPSLTKNENHVNIQCLIWPIEIIIIALSKILGKKVSIEAHDDPFFVKYKYRPFVIRKFILNLADIVIAHSHYTQRQLERIIPKGKILYIPLGPYIDAKDIKRGIVKSDILFFGFVGERKGIDVLLSAMKNVKRNLPSAKLLIIGPWEISKEKYLTFVEENGLKENIEIIDSYISLDESRPYFTGCKMVVLPHKYATQSSVPFIAYTYKKPVIASDIAGLNEEVKHNRTGLIFEPENPEDLGRGIVKLLKNENLRTKLGLGGYKLITRGEFSWKNITNMYVKLNKSFE